jgi:hypothetical protein
VTEQRSFLEKLQWIDRRWIYLLLFLAVTLPAVMEWLGHPISLPVHVFPDTLGVYNAIEETPRDKIVLVSCDWGFASLGENGPQTVTVIEHMLKKGVRFAVWSNDPAIPGWLQTKYLDPLAKKYGRKYGVDYVNFGYRYIPKRELFVQTVMDDLPGYFAEDYFHKPTRDMPVMRGIKNMSNVWLFYTVGADPTYDAWIGIAQPKYHMKVAFGSTGVMVPQTYPYLESGQLCGMLSGMRGGAEYEKKLNSPDLATWGITRQSMAHALIIVFVIFGNIGYFASRRRAQAS